MLLKDQILSNLPRIDISALNQHVPALRKLKSNVLVLAEIVSAVRIRRDPVGQFAVALRQQVQVFVRVDEGEADVALYVRAGGVLCCPVGGGRFLPHENVAEDEGVDEVAGGAVAAGRAGCGREGGDECEQA